MTNDQKKKPGFCGAPRSEAERVRDRRSISFEWKKPGFCGAPRREAERVRDDRSMPFEWKKPGLWMQRKCVRNY
jgi:hypothetical protein